MLSSFSSPQYVAVPYNVVQSRERQPMLQANPKDFHNSTGKSSSYFFLLASRVSSILGLLAVIMSVVWVSLILFDDKPIRQIYQTTSFFTSIDKGNKDSWQILSQTWSDLSKPNPKVDVQFNHYFECWYAAGIKTDVCGNNTEADYKSCIQGAFSTQLSTCASANDPNALAPSFNEYTNCINTAFQPTTQSLHALKICLRTNMWPLYESPENIDSWNFLGSFNWAILLTLGFGLFSCFALYTGGFVFNAESMDVKSDTRKNGPLSYTVTALCAVFALVFFLYFLVIAYRLPNNSLTGSNYLFPNSIPTNMVMIPATLIVFVYFAMELWDMTKEPKFLKELNMGQILQAHNMPHMPGYFRQPGEAGGYDKTWAETATHYFPALTLAWADGYMLDPIMAVGIVGASHQCSTSLLYQIFLAVFTYRFAHTAVARFMYEGYIYNPDEKEGKFDKTNGKISPELYAIRMQAMFMHLSAISALYMLWYIFGNDNFMLSENMFIYGMLYLWYIIPEVIRLAAHLIVAFRAVGIPDKNVLLSSNYFIWMWDIIIRFVFISIIIWGANNINGTQNNLLARHDSIYTMIAFMS